MSQSVSSEVKVITKHSFIYGLANVLDRIIGFIMLPVYTRFLTPADYGILELISMTMILLGSVISVGIQSAVSRFFFDYTDEENRRKVVSTAYVGYGSAIMIVTLAFLPFSTLMAKYVLGSVDYKSYFILALSSFSLDMFIQIAYAYIRAQQKSMMMMIISTSRTMIALSLNIYFVVFAHKGVAGILTSTLIANALYGMILTYYVLSKCGFRVDFKMLGKMLNFGLPLIPSNISGYLVQASDRFFIKEYASLTATGLYSLGYKFGTLVNQFVTSPFIQIWSPRRFEYFNKENSEMIYARIFTYFTAVSLLVGLLISLLSKEVIEIVATEPFWPAYKVVPIITLAYIIFSFHFHFNIGIMMKNATKYIAYVNIANAALNLVLNYFLIRYFELWGAATVALICFSFKAAMTYYFSNKLHKIQMEWKRVSILFLVAFGVYLLGFVVNTSSVWIDICLKTLIGISYPFVLYLARFFTDDEIAKFKHVIKTRKLDAI